MLLISRRHNSSKTSVKLGRPWAEFVLPTIVSCRHSFTYILYIQAQGNSETDIIFPCNFIGGLPTIAISPSCSKVELGFYSLSGILMDSWATYIGMYNPLC